jgi:hypothetical protein
MTSHTRFRYRFYVVGILLSALTAVASAQTPDAKLKPTGSISGRVTLDGKPAVGIMVAAIAGETVNRRDAAARTQTDSEGRYRVAGLAAGQYQVWTLTPGLIAPPGVVPYFGYSGSVKNIILTSNEEVDGIDMKLMRGGVITGRVTNADNKPVVEERVKLELLDEKGNPRFGAFTSTYDQMYQTDDRGVYRIFGLSPGRYKVSVGYDPNNDDITRGRRYLKTYHPATSDAARATIVELKEADEANNIDIKVQNPQASYAIAGRVVDGQGLPIAQAGVRVTLLRGSEPATGNIGFQADDRGEFSFSGFSAGHYAAYATSQYYGGNFYGDPVYFDITDKDVNGIELKAIPGLTVSGVVTTEGTSAAELLAVFPRLRVSAWPSSPSKGQLTSGADAAVAPDGSFQIVGLRPGRLSIGLHDSSTGRRPVIARIELNGTSIAQGLDVQESMSGIRVIVNYGTGGIRGTVRFAGDASIGDSRIYVTCKPEGAREGPYVPVDARGNFLIKNLTPGNYEVTLTIAPVRPGPGLPPQPLKQSVSVTNGAESEVNFLVDANLRPGGP